MEIDVTVLSDVFAKLSVVIQELMDTVVNVFSNVLIVFGG